MRQAESSLFQSLYDSTCLWQKQDEQVAALWGLELNTEICEPIRDKCPKALSQKYRPFQGKYFQNKIMWTLPLETVWLGSQHCKVKTVHSLYLISMNIKILEHFTAIRLFHYERQRHLTTLWPGAAVSTCCNNNKNNNCPQKCEFALSFTDCLKTHIQ